MNSNNENVNAAPGAAEWREREMHEAIVTKLAKIRGYRYVDYGDAVYGGGPYVTWKEDKPSLEELREILARGRHDEIMYLIERYNNAVSSEHQRLENRPAYLSMPEEIQELIALRGDQDEINAYLSVQGFGAKGQDVILDRGDHDEILSYVSRHGLLLEQQQKLLNRENDEEIIMHITRHGLADKIVDEMIEDVWWDNEAKLFNLFVQHHELPVFAQIKMLELFATGSGVIKDYISRYGLWNEAHITLLLHCSDEVVKAYFEMHHYLCPDAEDVLATLKVKERRDDLVNAYMRNWKGGNCRFLPYDHFLSALLKEPEANRDAIAHVLLNMPYNNCFIREETEADMELIKNGSDEALKARFNTGKLLHIRAFSELFFERDEKLFTDYVAKCSADSYYLC